MAQVVVVEQVEQVVTETGETTVLVVPEVVTSVVEVGVAGVQGIAGEDSTVPGPQGPPGAPGGSFSYVHDQAIPSATWTINHGLGGYPNVTIVDSSGRVVIGDIDYVDADTVVASFVGALGGKAYLS